MTETTKRIRVAVVGAGGWGRQHARVFSERPDVELCAVVGRSVDKTAARAAEWGIRPYTSIARMLEEEQPDFVSLSLPNEGHFDATLEIIEAGCPLLAEKPLVFELDEARALLDAAAQRDLFFAINFNHRYAEPVRRTRDAIERGELGDIVFATWRFGGEPGTSAHPHANLIETQCHGLDMLEHLCGPISSVMAQMTKKTHGVYSTLAVALEFANGSVGSLVGSYDSSYAYPVTHLLEVNGTEGRATVEDTVKRFTLSRAGDEARTVWEAGYFNDRDREFHRTFDKHVDALLEALRAGDPPPIHARAGLRALELAYAIISSFENGTRVEVPAVL
ncbi:MAG: Gfo/Idh/MocA family protein [Gaiellaceae bacterium]